VRGFGTASLAKGLQRIPNKSKKLALKVKKQCFETLRRWARKTRALAVAFKNNPRIVAVWYQDIREAVVHFLKWVKTGFRVFSSNIRASWYLLKRVTRGYPLTVREHKLLVRTTSDCFKLIPFSFFILIPFAELALPIFLRLFPNMLPSTFFEQKYDNATLARKFKAKEDMAEFWQEVMLERTEELLHEKHADYSAEKAELLEEFQEKLNDGVEFPTLKEIIKISKTFEKEFRLVNMTPDQLSALSRLLGLSTSGGNWWPGHVRVQLRHHISHIRREDRDYMWEGIDKLTRVELIEACKKRAIRFHEVTVSEMRSDLARWLELSAGNKDIPPVLLLWIQSFYLRASDPGSDEEIAKLPLKAGEELIKQAVKEEEDSEKQADLAFSEMAKRQKESAESAEKKLQELQDEIESVIETAARADTGSGSEQQEPDEEPRKSVTSITMEEKLEEKERVMAQVRELNKTLRLYKKVAGQQKSLIDKQLEAMKALRDNKPTKQRDADVILLDQRVRLHEVLGAFEKGIEKIDSLMSAKDDVPKDAPSDVSDIPSPASTEKDPPIILESIGKSTPREAHVS